MSKNLTDVIFGMKSISVNYIYAIHYRWTDKEMIGSIFNIGQASKDSTKKEKNIRCFILQITIRKEHS